MLGLWSHRFWGFSGPWCNEGKMAESHMKKGLLWEQHSPIHKQEAPWARFAMTASNLLMADKCIVLDKSWKKNQHAAVFYFFNVSGLLKCVNNHKKYGKNFLLRGMVSLRVSIVCWHHSHVCALKVGYSLTFWENTSFTLLLRVGSKQMISITTLTWRLEENEI